MSLVTGLSKRRLFRKTEFTDGYRADFEECVSPFYKDLFASALHLTRQREDAEDLVQDTLLRAFQGFGQFRKGSNLKAWLMRILTNTYINTYRKKRRKVQTVSLEAMVSDNEQGLELWEIIPDAHKDPEEEALSKVTDEQVKAALDELPDVYREVIVLCDLNELSYEEIAKMLKVPIGTVRSRISRGREMLRQRLYGYAKQHGFVR